MCINQESMMCCYMCSYTKAVWLIVLVEIFFGVGAAMIGNWTAVTIGCCVVFTLSFILCAQHSVFIRRLAFVVYLTLTIISVFDIVFVTVLLTFIDGKMQARFADYCRDHPALYPDRFSTVDECVTYVRVTTIALFVFFSLIILVMRVCFCRILYYGMRE